jgi:hypothetical protein
MTRGRTASAAVAITPAGTREAVVAVAILGVAAAGPEVEVAFREAGWDDEEAWVAGEDNKAIAAEVP